ncbi:hypothetical protein ACFSTC_42045 [Nonomuraea ferruginea]
MVRRGPGGKPVVLPAYGEGAGTAHVRLLLSADGRRLLVDFSDAAKRRDGVVVDTSSGRTLRGVPAGDRALGFSADGDEVLATRDRPDRTVQVVVHRLRGGSHAVTPPQEVVIHHTALALAADGRTLLALLPQGLTSEKAPQQVRRYDLRRGAWLGPGRVVGPRYGAGSLEWGAERAELRLVRELGGHGRRVVLDPRPRSGDREDPAAGRVRDRSHGTGEVMINAMLVLSLVITGVPAGAEGTHIRYAVQRVCGEKACGKLRLVLADGSAHELPDTSTGEGHEPVAVSADGSRVAYFRAGDRRLIAYELGGKRRFVGTVKQPANEVGVDATRLLLSPDGSRLAYLPNDPGRRIRVYDVRSGRAVGTLPAEDGFSCTAGFSGDGGELLRVEESMLIAARVTDLRGRTLRRDVPPQVVAHNLPR